jgi:hypothetical protein
LSGLLTRLLALAHALDEFVEIEGRRGTAPLSLDERRAQSLDFRVLRHVLLRSLAYA